MECAVLENQSKGHLAYARLDFACEEMCLSRTFENLHLVDMPGEQKLIAKLKVVVAADKHSQTSARSPIHTVSQLGGCLLGGWRQCANYY